MRAGDVEARLLRDARRGDRGAFDELVAPYRAELRAHCYRMLGSVHDADDTLQDALLGAWRGIEGFAERSSLRAWLYRIATNAAIRVAARRPRRQLSLDYAPPSDPAAGFGEPIMDPVWLEPYPDAALREMAADPAARYELLESVELAFVAALQRLPATQRAVLILREVLGFSAAETAGLLETSVASVNSALQRARATIAARAGGPSQRATLPALGGEQRRRFVDAFVTAWARADVVSITDMLVADARLSMPPLPVWFDGRAAIARFMARRMFATPWRLVPITANGQLAFACYQQQVTEGPFRLGAINVVRLRGDRVAELTAFLNPADHAAFALPAELPRGR